MISTSFGRLLLKRWAMFLAMWVSSTVIGILAGAASYLFLKFFLLGQGELQRNMAFWAFAAMGFFFGLFGAFWFMIKNWTRVSEMQALARNHSAGAEER